MTKIRSLSSLATTSFMMSLLLFGNTAFAATPPSAPALNSGAGQNSSYNWAGYVTQGNNITSISGSWAVSPIPANASTADATWIGIGGVTSNDLIQVGTERLIDASGTITYQAFYEMLPQNAVPISLTINPGDVVSASLNEESTNEWIISLKDLSSGQSFQTTVAYTSSLSAADWIEEMPSNGRSLIPINNFGTVSFTGLSATENGTLVTPLSAGAQAMTMVNNAGQALTTTSGIGADGESFAVTRTSAAPTAIGLSASGRAHRVGSGVQGYRARPQQFMMRRQFYIVRLSTVGQFGVFIQMR